MKKIPNDLRITIGAHVLDRQKTGKFLGVHLDDKLTFNEHIKHVYNKTSKLTGLFYKLKQFFPLYILKNLYYTLLYPYLTYCILAWGCAKQNVLMKINLLQKKVVRILTNSDYYAHTNCLFKSLKILKFPDLYVFHSQLLMHKILTLNRYPEKKREILELQTNHRYENRNNLLRKPYCRIDKCQQMLTYQIIKNWNLLPSNEKNHLSVVTFKSHCKSYLIDKY